MPKSLPEIDKMIDHIMITSELIWPKKITKASLEEWLSNFKGEIYSKKKEHQYALWLLLNFVYYNEGEVRHLCKTLYKDFIHQTISKDYKEDIKLEERLQDIRQRTIFHHLGRPGESGGFILYYFRKENKLSYRDFLSDPALIHKNIDHIVFVDDVTLSGASGQAIRYLEEEVDKYFKNKRITLLTLLASKEAKEYLTKNGYNVINCVTLYNRNKCFSNESNVFTQFPNELSNCLKFARHYGEKIEPGFPLGYNNGQYLFGFFYNTPDNSLPIFWSERNGWNPIIKRYHKNYGKTKYNEFGRFV